MKAFSIALLSMSLLGNGARQVQAQSYDCQTPFNQGIALPKGNVMLYHVVNPVDETITMQLIYPGLAWLGVAFSPTGQMVGTQGAVIGLPGSSNQAGVNPAKYELAAKDVNFVTPMDWADQTLTWSQVQQNGTHTSLAFTKYLKESNSDEAEVDPNDINTIIYAVGPGNDLAQHAIFGSYSLQLQECIELDANGNPVQDEDENEDGDDGAVQQPDAGDGGNANDDGGIANGDCIPSIRDLRGDGQIILNEFVDNDAGTATFELSYAGIGWLGLGFSPNGNMVGNVAVIGRPDINTVQKYNLGGKSVAAVGLLPDGQQTLTDASIAQNDTHTVMRFTKLLNEDGELAIDGTGQNIAIFAVGPANFLSEHAIKGSFGLALTACGSGQGGVQAPTELFNDAVPKENLWKAHGILMAVGWGILVPMAIGSSLIRHLLPLPPGWWFKLHAGCNMIAILCIMAAFGIAVHNINYENGKHFSEVKHRKVGLVVVIMALLQAANGLLRPHLPHAPTPAKVGDEDAEAGETERAAEPEMPAKSTARKAWEIGHRLLGASALGLAWYNCHTGIDIFYKRFGGKDMTNVFWGVVAPLSGCILLAAVGQFTYRRFTKKDK